MISDFSTFLPAVSLLIKRETSLLNCIEYRKANGTKWMARDEMDFMMSIY
jgi:hypothetical protein